MIPLPTFALPLPSCEPPSGYGWSERPLSDLSKTTAFLTGLDERDKFLGKSRCVICGYSRPERCNIIKDSYYDTWNELKDRRWIPEQAKRAPRHEPRNGMLMCPNHQTNFDRYDFFIRFLPDIRRFVLIDYSDSESLQGFHGKAIALDIEDKYAPFPSLFIIHEMRVRGFHPFKPVVPTIPNEISWPDWIVKNNMFDYASDSFKRGRPTHSDNDTFSAQTQLQAEPTTTGVDGGSSSQRTLALNADVISEILAAAHAMPSWKACQVEGTSWTGTAEENAEKYVSSFGAEDR